MVNVRFLLVNALRSHTSLCPDPAFKIFLNEHDTVAVTHPWDVKTLVQRPLGQPQESGGFINSKQSHITSPKARILHPYIPTAILLYLPWALLQQTLFQFYLLGRMCTLCPSLHPLAQSLLNGLIFGAVHITDIGVVLLAVLGGTLWSFLYLRYRRLWPLAVSHAVIGTTFYYWVYGYDLAGRWSAFLGSLYK